MAILKTKYLNPPLKIETTDLLRTFSPLLCSLRIRLQYHYSSIMYKEVVIRFPSSHGDNRKFRGQMLLNSLTQGKLANDMENTLK